MPQKTKEPKPIGGRGSILWYDTGHGDLFDPRVIAVVAKGLIDELGEAGFFPAAKKPKAVSRSAPP